MANSVAERRRTFRPCRRPWTRRRWRQRPASTPRSTSERLTARVARGLDAAGTIVGRAATTCRWKRSEVLRAPTIRRRRQSGRVPSSWTSGSDDTVATSPTLAAGPVRAVRAARRRSPAAEEDRGGAGWRARRGAATCGTRSTRRGRSGTSRRASASCSESAVRATGVRRPTAGPPAAWTTTEDGVSGGRVADVARTSCELSSHWRHLANRTISTRASNAARISIPSARGRWSIASNSSAAASATQAAVAECELSPTFELNLHFVAMYIFFALSRLLRFRVVNLAFT